MRRYRPLGSSTKPTPPADSAGSSRKWASLRASLAGAAFAGALSLLLSGCPQPNPTPDPASDTNDSAGSAAAKDHQASSQPEASRTPQQTPDSNTKSQGAADSVRSDSSGSEDATKQSPSDAPRPTTDERNDAPQAGSEPESKPEPPTVPASSEFVPKGTDAKLFEGWPAPQAVLAITGEQHGYIEPCGCTGLANQRGGLARRYTFLQSLRNRGWDVVAIDTGDQIRRFGVQAEIKFQSTVAGLKQMGYQAVALGPDDLRLSAPMLAGLAVPAGDEPSLFFSGSAHLFGDANFLPRFRVLKAGRLKIGVTSVIGPSRMVELNSDDVSVVDPRQAAEAAGASLERAGCDWTILIVQGSLDDARTIAQDTDHFDIVVCSGEPGEPTRLPQAIEGSRAKLILVGYKGMHVGVLGFYGGQATEFRYQRVPLDARFPDAKPMLQLLADYQNTLKLKGLEGLGVRPLPHPSGRKFVGSDTCADCHEEAYAIWKDGIDGGGGPHWHATESLIHPGERSEIPRHYDPECLSCHVTGWNPQQYYPYESGYLNLEQSKHLLGNGCENCHGPASAHVAAENGEVEADDAKLEKLRQELHLSVDGADRRCMECHDLDNSPDFHVPGAFEKYWAKIRH